MNARYQQIADFIDECWEKHWTSPNVRQIGEHVGLSSPSTVHQHLGNMVRAGILERHQLDRVRVLYRVIR